ncbi:MAG: Bax inhibitor-1/YccA family protein [Planctomycetaceae bacterium]|nr:Bax inhibitor-1/YccA family protein [Planctomycetaceae bacterium]
MRSSNPALSESVFHNFETYGDSTRMTVSGTAVKSMIAVLLVMLTAGLTWMRFQQAGGIGGNGAEAVMPLMLGGLIVGLIAFGVTMFKPNLAAWTTPVYALAEGCLLGGVSAFIQARIPQQPIVFQAVLLTFGTLFVMLTVYQSGLIRVTDKLRMGIVAATGAIALLYLASFVMRFFGMQIGFIHSAGPLGIGFSLFVVGLAAFNLLLDFDLIDRMAASGAPKHMEWYGAFALLVTLVWLYMEILRLLSKLNRRD